MSTDTRPYECLAGIYDYVMRHVDYEQWAAYLSDLFTRFDHLPRALVELACGTGNIALHLSELGYPVLGGADASESMLRVARERALKAGQDMRFECCDLRQADELRDLELGPVSTAVCMYDSFNYLCTLDDVHEALGAVTRLLEPGGLFVFDVCTEQNSLRYFRDVRDSESGPGFSYKRHSHYDVASRLQVNDFAIRFEGSDELVQEHHEQRIYAVVELQRAIEASDLLLLGAFDGYTFSRGTEQSDRIHFALQRPAV